MAKNDNHFGLRLDTEGPVFGSPTYSPASGKERSSWYGQETSSVSMTVTVSDRAGAAKYYRAYIDESPTPVAEGAAIPNTAIWKNSTTGGWSTIDGDSITVTATYAQTQVMFGTETKTVDACVRYIHIQVMDDVGNKASEAGGGTLINKWLTSKAIVIDHEEMTVSGNIDGTTILTKEVAGHTLTVNAAYPAWYEAAIRTEWEEEPYPPCPIKQVKIEGDFTESPITEDYVFTANKLNVDNEEHSITLTAGDGWKYATITVTNWAGNEFKYTLNKADLSAIELDQTAAEIHAGIVNKIGEGEYGLVDSPTNKTGLAAAIEVELDAQGKHDIKSVAVTVDGVAAGTPHTITGTESVIYVDDLNIAEGTHTVVITATDTAGNQTVETINNFVVDRTAPNITINQLTPDYIGTDGKAWYKGSSIVSITVTTNSDIAGFGSGSIIVSDLDAHAVTVATLKNDVLVETYTCDITALCENQLCTITGNLLDKAGNSAHNLTRTFFIDKSAPTIALVSPNATALNTWFNEKFPISVGYTETGSGLASMEAWVSEVAVDTAVPTGTTKVTSFAGSPAELSTATINYAGLKQSTTNYLHVKAVDNVGNVSYIHQVFKYDSEINQGTITTSTPVIASTTAGKVTISFTPAVQTGADLSGYDSYMLTGDILSGGVWVTLTSAELAAGKKVNIPVSVTPGDGEKTISLTLKDKAGNVTTVDASTIITLDTVHPVAEAKLVNCQGVHTSVKWSNTIKDDPSSNKTADLVIRDLNDTTEDYVEYKIWGADFGLPATEDDDQCVWIKLTAAQIAALHSNDGLFIDSAFHLTCTDNAGTASERKTVYIKLRDDTGVTSSTASASFEYDPIVAEITVSAVDYTVISKVTSARRNSDGTEKSGTQCNKMTFKFSANKPIVAWRVCAYLRQADAEAGSHADGAIPTTGGSVNMTGTTTVAAGTAVSCTIMGADYESCLEANVVISSDLNILGKNTDGIHYVVVYGQNEAGDWSSAAIFA